MTRGAARMPDAPDRRHLSKFPDVWDFAANEKAPSQAETCKGALLRSRSPFPGQQARGSGIYTTGAAPPSWELSGALVGAAWGIAF